MAYLLYQLFLLEFGHEPYHRITWFTNHDGPFSLVAPSYNWVRTTCNSNDSYECTEVIHPYYTLYL